MRLSPLVSDDAARAADALVPAFRDDPNMSWCFAAEQSGYEDRLRGYLQVGHAWHVSLGHPALGAFERARLVAACYAMLPDVDPPAELVDSLWSELQRACGPGATERFRRYNEEVERVTPEGRHHVIAIVGVHPASQRSGIGSRLVGWVTGLADADPASDGVLLDTASDANVRFYARHGFSPVAEVSFDGFVERVLHRPAAR